MTRPASAKLFLYAGMDSEGSTTALPKAPDLVRLGELDSTTLSLNLSECIRVQPGVGKYELIVKSVEPEESFRDQMAVKNFEVY